MEIVKIPLDDLFMDEGFNSRDKIEFTQVLDLAKSIKKDGLIQPIVVMPSTERPDKKYKVAAGHRRTKAHMILQNDDPQFSSIQAIIREDLDEKKSRVLNLNENLNRKNLNILEEAMAIEPLLEMGMTEQEMVDSIPTASRGWIQVRCMLLKLPKAIQEEASVGFVNQTHIRDLYSMKHAGMTDEALFEQVKKAKISKQKGEAYKILKKEGPKQKSPAETKHARNRSEIFVMIKHMLETQVEGLPTRALSWASGEISDLEFFMDLQDHVGVGYVIPRQGLDYAVKV